MRRCCQVCAKGLGQRCGGDFYIFGQCGKGLICTYARKGFHHFTYGPYDPYGICVSFHTFICVSEDICVEVIFSGHCEVGFNNFQYVLT